VVFPWGSPPSPDAPGKELYLVPLYPSDPVPEYLQLLDHVQLPDARNATMVLGFFVLHRPKVPLSQASAVPNAIPAPDDSHTSNAAQYSKPSGIDISSITAEYLAGILQNPALNQTLGATASTSEAVMYSPPSHVDLMSSSTFATSQTSTSLQALYPNPSTPTAINQQSPTGRMYANAQLPPRGRSPDHYSRRRRNAPEGSRSRGRGRNSGWNHVNYSPVDNGWGNRRSNSNSGPAGDGSRF